MSAVGEPVESKADDKVHSGRLLLRMPGPLHAQLAEEAEKRGTSLNQLIVGLLSGSLTDGSSRLAAPGSEPRERGLAAISQRRLGLALALNLVVLLVAAVVAIALLIGAWF